MKTNSNGLKIFLGNDCSRLLLCPGLLRRQSLRKLMKSFYIYTHTYLHITDCSLSLLRPKYRLFHKTSHTLPIYPSSVSALVYPRLSICLSACERGSRCRAIGWSHADHTHKRWRRGWRCEDAALLHTLIIPRARSLRNLSFITSCNHYVIMLTVPSESCTQISFTSPLCLFHKPSARLW